MLFLAFETCVKGLIDEPFSIIVSSDKTTLFPKMLSAKTAESFLTETFSPQKTPSKKQPLETKPLFDINDFFT